ncbi:MAG TPA: TolC family protein [Gemmata sp.]|nr:TolC family protein [Gemmata sp.]
MSRQFTISAAILAACFAVAAAQQPKANDRLEPKDGADPKSVPQKKADSTDAAVAAALRNDTDVRIAQAKVQLAEAELAKAKQAVVIKVITLRASIDEHRVAVEQASERAAWAVRMHERGMIDQRQVMEERAKLAVAKSALSKVEAELKLLTGDSDRTVLEAWMRAAAPPDHKSEVTRGIDFLLRQQYYDRAFEGQVTAADFLARIADRPTVKGPIPDRIRAALDKTVKLGAKGAKVTFEKALEVFKKEAGLDVPVRGEFPKLWYVEAKKPNDYHTRPIEIALEGEELPVVAWFQLFEDNAVGGNRNGAMRYRFYVREYGLLIAPVETAPPGAPTITDFWKQKPPAQQSAPDPREKGK